MQVSLTVTITAEVDNQEEADYFLDAATNSPSVPFLADVVDCLDGIVVKKILSINDKTPDQIKAALQVSELP